MYSTFVASSLCNLFIELNNFLQLPNNQLGIEGSCLHFFDISYTVIWINIANKPQWMMLLTSSAGLLACSVCCILASTNNNRSNQAMSVKTQTNDDSGRKLGKTKTSEITQQGVFVRGIWHLLVIILN